MGYLHYGDGRSFAFSDRVLTHLRTVVFGKFAVRESFVFTWVTADAQHSLWLHPTLPLHFEFDHGVTPEINEEWIEQLLALAHSPAGLRLIPEPRRDETSVERAAAR